MALAILADIGGTNTRVALAEGSKVLTATIERFPNAAFKARGEDIGAILRSYLARSGARPEGVCVAAAGPVQKDIAEMTNLSWVIDAGLLREATGASQVALLNDLQAQGHALGHIPPQSLRALSPDAPQLASDEAQSPMLVVGLGTGVNAAPVHGFGASRLVPASESGHMSMPARSAGDFRLICFIEDRLRERGEVAHCGVEEVLSGRGLSNLYAFTSAEAGSPAEKAPGEVLEAIARQEPPATAAAALYCRILAQFLGDLALTHLPWGGIYLIGGMARAMAPCFEQFDLDRQFRQSRRIDLLTHSFALHVVEDDYAALTGCAAWLAAARP